MLAAIKAAKGGKTAEKIEQETGQDAPSILDQILGFFGGAQTAMKVLQAVGTFFMGPVGIAILGAASLAGLAYMMWKAKPESHEQASKVSGAADSSTEGKSIMEAAGGEDTDSAIERKKANILANRPSSKKTWNVFKDGEGCCWTVHDCRHKGCSIVHGHSIG